VQAELVSGCLNDINAKLPSLMIPFGHSWQAPNVSEDSSIKRCLEGRPFSWESVCQCNTLAGLAAIRGWRPVSKATRRLCPLRDAVVDLLMAVGHCGADTGVRGQNGTLVDVRPLSDEWMSLMTPPLLPSQEMEFKVSVNLLSCALSILASPRCNTLEVLGLVKKWRQQKTLDRRR
jgi:hypothetical protein